MTILQCSNRLYYRRGCTRFPNTAANTFKQTKIIKRIKSVLKKKSLRKVLHTIIDGYTAFPLRSYACFYKMQIYNPTEVHLMPYPIKNPKLYREGLQQKKPKARSSLESCLAKYMDTHDLYMDPLQTAFFLLFLFPPPLHPPPYFLFFRFIIMDS